MCGGPLTYGVAPGRPAGVSEVDLTPVWYKEAAQIGSIDYSVDSGSVPSLPVPRTVIRLTAGSTSSPLVCVPTAGP